MTPHLSHGSPLRAFAHRPYALFMAGHGLSLCGSWMQTLARAWLVYRLTGSPFLLGLVEFLNRAPIFFFGVLGGLFADRLPRYRTMVVTQTLLLLNAGLLAALTMSGAVTIEWVMALAVCEGLIFVVEIPVRQSFMTGLVPKEDIPSAIGLNSTLFNAARVIGPSIAGLLVGLFGEGLCFALNAASYAVVLGCLAALVMPPVVQAEDGHPLHLLKEGFAYAWRTAHVRSTLALVALLSIVAMPFATLLPVFAGEVLRGGPKDLGLLMAATGVGALAGALHLARHRSVRGLPRAIGVAAALFGAGLLAMSAASTLWVLLPVLTVIGFAMVNSFAAVNTLLQSLAPDGLRGRVVGLYASLNLGMTMFGNLLGGSSAALLGAPATVAIGGILTVLGAAIYWKVRADLGAEEPLLAPEPSALPPA